MNRARCFLLLRLLIAVCAAGLFLLLAPHVREANGLTDFDHCVSRDMAELRPHVPVLRVILFALTLLASLKTMYFLVPLSALIVWSSGQRNAALIVLLCGITAGVSNSRLKHHYKRYRPGPEVRDPWVSETNQSFPSGHSSSSMAVFGLLGYLSWRRGRTQQQRFWIVVGFALLILTIGFSRIFLCAHWVSDVMGGYLLGLFWLMVWISVASAVKERPASS